MKFDKFTENQIGYYVYALIDPDNGIPFYIGKGHGNRIFQHVSCALKEESESDNYKKIKEILKRNKEVKHIILRYGLDEDVAYTLEATIIDFCFLLKKFPLFNQVSGHGSSQTGIMNANEIIRKYQALPLTNLRNDALIININKKYKKNASIKDIYEATRGLWRMGSKKPTAKYVLSEYRGRIVGVFKVTQWTSRMTPATKTKKPHLRWEFNGKIAPKNICIEYLNKSINKKLGTSNPILKNLPK